MYGVWKVKHTLQPYLWIFASGSAMGMGFTALAVMRNENLRAHPAFLIAFQSIINSYYLFLGVMGPLVCRFNTYQWLAYSLRPIMGEEFTDFEALRWIWIFNRYSDWFLFELLMMINITMNVDFALCIYNPMKQPKRRYIKEVLFCLAFAIIHVLILHFVTTDRETDGITKGILTVRDRTLITFLNITTSGVFFISALGSLGFIWWKLQKSGIVIAKEQKTQLIRRQFVYTCANWLGVTALSLQSLHINLVDKQVEN